MLDKLLLLKAKRLGKSIERAYGPPVIIIGMHRSGTSLVTRLLREVGGYFGSQLEQNSESQVFLSLNNAILESAGGTWDSLPKGFGAKKFFTNTRGVQIILQNQAILWSYYFESFGGIGVEVVKFNPQMASKSSALIGRWWLKTMRLQRTMEPFSSFWGWKDPRNTFTLSIWLQLFPNAQVINVVRNGIDSALSLWTRCEQFGVGAPYCLDMTYCFDLWERYVKEAQYWRSLSSDRYYEIRYEDLLCNPGSQINKLLSFVGAQCDSAELLSRQVKCSKSDNRHWLNYPRLVEQAQSSALFAALGYSTTFHQ